MEAQQQTPETEATPPTTTTQAEQSKPANAEAFSSDDIAEINLELGVEATDQERTTNDHLGSGVSEPTTTTGPSGVSGDSGDFGDGVQSNSEHHSLDTENVVSLEEEREKRIAQEQAAKDIFYDALCGSCNYANGRLTRRDPFGKYDALDLRNRETVYRPMSDQIFDRLCDVPMFKRWLYKLNDSTIMDKWGAILMGIYTLQTSLNDERKERVKMYKQMQAEESEGKAA